MIGKRLAGFSSMTFKVISLNFVIASVCGIGVVFMVSMCGGSLFFVNNLVCCFMLKWCCLLMMVMLSELNIIFLWIKACVLIIILIFLLFKFLRICVCLVVFVELVSNVIFGGFCICESKFVSMWWCCVVSILVGVMNAFWCFVLIVARSVMVVMIVLLYFILFWSRCNIGVGLVILFKIFLSEDFWDCVSVNGNSLRNSFVRVVSIMYTFLVDLDMGSVCKWLCFCRSVICNKINFLNVNCFCVCVIVLMFCGLWIFFIVFECESNSSSVSNGLLWFIDIFMGLVGSFVRKMFIDVFIVWCYLILFIVLCLVYVVIIFDELDVNIGVFAVIGTIRLLFMLNW